MLERKKDFIRSIASGEPALRRNTVMRRNPAIQLCRRMWHVAVLHDHKPLPGEVDWAALAPSGKCRYCGRTIGLVDNDRWESR